MWGDPNKLSRDNLQKEDINPGVQYTGVPSQDELSRCPGVPTETRVKLGRVACIECVQEIPCNPCEGLCKFGAITIGEQITNLPRLHEDKCVGCGLSGSGHHHLGPLVLGHRGNHRLPV